MWREIVRRGESEGGECPAGGMSYIHLSINPLPLSVGYAHVRTTFVLCIEL